MYSFFPTPWRFFLVFFVLFRLFQTTLRPKKKFTPESGGVNALLTGVNEEDLRVREDSFFVTVGAPLTDFRFFLGGTRTVKTGDVLFLLGFRLHFLFLWLAKFGTFEGDARSHRGRYFIVADVSLHMGIVRGILVVEEANSREGHGNVVLVARFDDMIVTNRATGLRHIANTAAVGPFYVVAEGEEGVRT